MLKDLSSLIVECRNIFDSVSTHGDVLINMDLKELLLNSLKTVEPKSQWDIRDYSILVINENGLRAELPSSWLWYGYAFCGLSKALNEYKNIIETFKKTALAQDIEAKDLEKLLTNLPSEQYHKLGLPSEKLLEKIISEDYDNQDKEYLEHFLTNRAWWYSPLKSTRQTQGKTLDRSDAFKSALLLAAGVIVANADRLTVLIEAFSKSDDLYNYFENEIINNITAKKNVEGNYIPLQAGINKIYYGAPGTGKSYRVNNKVGGNDIVRTVFHPDTQYSDFVGSLKPKTKLDSSGNTRISYEFRSGPFIDAYIKAVSHKKKPVYLVIEEINRAPAAAVFGELFQLLDRNSDGSGVYEINISDPDMLEYINEKVPSPITSLKIPANLSILATMNSSDQAVMPMDTAFKRRWLFEYVSIDYANATFGSIPIIVSAGFAKNKIETSWSDFSRIINYTLSRLLIPEDRLLGHRFLSESELQNSEAAKQALSGKLFVYLWDDVLRHGQREAIFNTEKFNTFGELSAAFLRDEPVFSEEIELKLSDVSEKKSQDIIDSHIID
ncbi:McrB family protein [Rahnella sp. AN3-3W3]|uniref:McrB family protein n=1 Tax=Rahnella sp. AN3-3W3 TaxID=1610578 RepID=UPI001E625ECE|nr:AAA family ATPase [Rahnella sp. AN3-3W3]